MKKIGLFFVLFLFIFNGCAFNSQPVEEVGNSTSDPSESVEQEGVFLQGIPSDDFETMSLEDFPSVTFMGSRPGALVWHDRVFVLSLDYVSEYTWEGEMLAYTDPELIQTPRDIALRGDSLFIACFGSGVYEINLNSNQIVHVYDESTGLLNLENLQVAIDGDWLWVGTFEGVAKIDLRDGTTEFYDNELEVEATHFGSTVYARDGEVWVEVNVNAHSEGGVAHYDYENNTWTAYGPESFKTADFDRIDVGFILSDEGAFVEFQDGGPDQTTLKKFNPETGVWDIVYVSDHAEFDEGVLAYLPAPETYTVSQVEFVDYEIMKKFSVYDQGQWKEFEIPDIYYKSLVKGPGNVYYLLNSLGLESFSKGENWPQLLMESDSLYNRDATMIITEDASYLAFFSAQNNDMGGQWLNFGVGVYNINTGTFFEDSFDLTQMDFVVGVEGVPETVEALEYRYDGNQIVVPFSDQGQFIVDLAAQTLSFETIEAL